MTNRSLNKTLVYRDHLARPPQPSAAAEIDAPPPRISPSDLLNVSPNATKVNKKMILFFNDLLPPIKLS